MPKEPYNSLRLAHMPPYDRGTHMVVRETGTNPVVKIGSLSECQATVNRLLLVSPVEHRIEPLDPGRWKK